MDRDGGSSKFWDRHPFLWSAWAAVLGAYFAFRIISGLRDGRFVWGTGSKAQTITRVHSPIQFWTTVGVSALVYLLVLIVAFLRFRRWARKGRS
jgi:hypothetical protein